MNKLQNALAVHLLAVAAIAGERIELLEPLLAVAAIDGDKGTY